MSQQKKRIVSLADTTTSTLNMFTGSEGRGEMQMSSHVVTAGNQLTGKLLPEFSSEKGSPKLKSRPPSSSQRREKPYAMVIPTAPNETPESSEGKTLPKVYTQPERTIAKGYPRPQVPPARPSTARETTSSMKIVMKGKTVPKGRSGALSPIEKGNKMSTLLKEDGKFPAPPPVTRAGTDISGIEFSSTVPIPGTIALKPAILPCVGNVKSLPLAEKKKKNPKYKVCLKKPKVKLQPILPDKKPEQIEMEIEPEEINLERQQSDLGQAHNAVKLLVHEAVVLTQTDNRPPTGKSKVMKQEVSSMEIRDEIHSGSAPRSVDEIIESLWEQVDSETISESDRRIQEIMDRVMSRGISQRIEKIQEKSEEPSEKADEFAEKQTIVEEEEEEEEEKVEEKETFVPPEYEDDREDTIVTETEPTITDEDDVCITAASGPWDIESLQEEDLTKLKAALDLPLNVSREDILSLKGEHVKTFSQIPPGIVKKSDQKKKIEMSFLGSWNYRDIITGGGTTSEDPKRERTYSKPTIKQHHFCSISSEFEIKSPFTHAGWHYHTPNRYQKDFPINDCRKSILNDSKAKFSATGRFTETSETFNEVLDKWLGQAENMFTDIELTIKGDKAPTIMNDNIHFWTLSPPKLHILPSIIKQIMFPNYHGSFFPGRYMSQKKRVTREQSAAKRLADSADMTEEEMEEFFKQRLNELKSQSVSDLANPYPVPYLKDIIPPEMMLEAKTLSNLSSLLEIEKCSSETYCPKGRDKMDIEPLPSDFESLNQEMLEHKKRIGEMNKRRMEMEEEELPLTADIYTEDDSASKGKDHVPNSRLVDFFRRNKSRLKRSQSVTTDKSPKILEIVNKKQASLRGRRNSKESTSIDLGVVAEKKSDAVSRDDCRKSVCESGQTPNKELEDELSVYNRKQKISRWLSDFNPPTWTEGDEGSAPVSFVLPYDEANIDYSTDKPAKLAAKKKIEEEIAGLTKQIEQSPDDWIFDTCRRGVLYRKIGELNKSSKDLNKVIRLEPSYLDAFWHRHFVHVLRGNVNAAHDDLNYILERKPQYKTYLAAGLLCEHSNNSTGALANYTKAIAFDESGWLAYYYRAKLYEATGKSKFAIGDFIKVAERNTTHIEALKKQAAYFLTCGKWNLTISKCTELLELTNDGEVYLIRGEAYIGLRTWSDALNDLTTAIHLVPSLWKAFYLRACLLKNNKKQWDRALMDFSISLLLNDSEENILAYNYRGILYVKRKCLEQAAADFKSVLEFEPDNINALLNLGLVQSRSFRNFPQVVECFTKVLKLDPFHIKAYEFRALTYTKLYKYNAALKDYTRILHMEPNNYKYYIYLGSVFQKLKKLEIASYFIKLIANVEDTIGLPSELASVHSYLKNMDKALAVLDKALEKDPGNVTLLINLGKTQLQAKQYQNSVATFQALKVFMVTNKKNKCWPEMADEVFYNLGLVYMEMSDYKKALGAFNHAVDINPKHAQCFYSRGLAKIQLNFVHCVIDFNRALAIEPKYFEVYLSRAAYYAMKNQHTKAILNCNEALKIHKNSVRALLYRGSIKYSIHAYQLAVDDLTKAIQLNANCALAFFNRANCFEALEEYQKALQDYSVVLLINNDLEYDVFINRGCLYYQMGEFENAREDFKQASHLKPDNYNIIHAWGLSLHKLGMLNEAEEKFTTCIRINCHFSDAYISRGNVFMDYVREKETLLARSDYQRAIHINPDDVLARICLGYSLQVSRKFVRAWHQFSEAFMINPNSEDALEGRAAIFLQMGNTYGAFQDLTAAIRINPTAELYNNRGVVNQYMKCLRDAMTDYKHAIDLDPEYALAYYNAANIYLHGRFFKQALKYFDEAINLDNTDECAFINRAVTKVMLKDVEGASADFAQAINMCPYYAHIYYNRGNLYASLQMHPLAEKDFTSALEILPDDPMTLVQRANVRGKMGKKDLAIADYKRAMEVKDKLRKLL